MTVTKTKGGKFKGFEITKDEQLECLKVLKDNCLAVAVRELMANWGVQENVAFRILSAVTNNYKTLKII